MKKHLVVFAVLAMVLALGIGTATAAPTLTATKKITFSPTAIHSTLPTTNISYASATVTNNGTVTLYLMTADAAGAFQATWDGTCNNYPVKALLAGESCTFGFSFAPTEVGMNKGTGYIRYGPYGANTPTEIATVALMGKGTAQ